MIPYHKNAISRFLCIAMCMAFYEHAQSAVVVSVDTDTFIASNDVNKNFETDGVNRFLHLRSVSAVTRATFVQFTLPALGEKDRLEDALLTFRAATTGSGFPDVEVLATTAPVNLSSLTWNSAISSGLLTGTGLEADYTMSWGGGWTLFSQTLVLGTVNASTPVGGSFINYSSPGMLNYLRDQMGDTPVTVTFALGFAATETSSGIQIRSEQDSGSGYVASGGPYAPTLTLDIVTIPEPASAMLFIFSAVLILGARRRFQRTSRCAS